MKAFEQMTIKQLKEKILHWEQDSKNPKSIEIVCIGLSDNKTYIQGDGTRCEQFCATLLIDGEMCNKGYEWCLDDEEISASWNLDEEDDGDNDEPLPAHIVQRCKYMGQPLDTTELCYSNVVLNESLKVPVTHIRMGYPFRIEGGGSYNVYKITSAKTWGELLTETIKVFQREYKADKAVAPHQLSDYIIELVDVHPNGLATIAIGS